MKAPDKIAYVLKGFPRLSESFIANEVRLLEHYGLDLGLFSIKQGDTMAAANDLPPVLYLPAVTSLSQTSLRDWLRANLSKFGREQKYWLRYYPLRYFKTLGFALACSIRYRNYATGPIKKTFIKEFLLATYIARQIQLDGGYTYIHAHFCHDATTVAWMISRLTGLRFSFTAHAKDIYQDKLNPGDLLQRKLAAAEFVTTCTLTNVNYLSSLTSTPEKIHGIYHGLDTTLFTPTGTGLESTSGGSLKLLTVGRHVEKKGFVYLVEACHLLRQRGVRFSLDIIGERGDQTERLQADIEGFELGDLVHLLPPIPQYKLKAHYNRAHAFVLPCIVVSDGDRDGIPNVMAEAMASGLPVVVTGISGIPEIVEDGVNGLIVPTADSGALADALHSILSKPELRKALGTAGRQRIEEVFDARDTHKVLLKVFEQTLEGRKMACSLRG